VSEQQIGSGRPEGIPTTGQWYWLITSDLIFTYDKQQLAFDHETGEKNYGVNKTNSMH